MRLCRKSCVHVSGFRDLVTTDSEHVKRAQDGWVIRTMIIYSGHSIKGPFRQNAGARRVHGQQN